MVGGAMQISEGTKTIVPSKLVDLSGVPLAEMPTLGTVADDARSRVLVGRQAIPVPVAVFQSSI